MAECDIFKKNLLKLNILKEITSGDAKLALFLESEGVEKDFMSIRAAGADSYRFNNFSITENTAENTLVFMPVVIGCPAYIKIECGQSFEIAVLRNQGEQPAQTFTMKPGTVKLDLYLNGYTSYIMRVTQVSVDNAALTREKDKVEIGQLNTKISEVETKLSGLAAEKDKLIKKLDALQAEYDKDYRSFEKDVAEIRSKYTVDEEILKLYEDKDVTPIEQLIARSRRDLEEMEEQIRVFVGAHERQVADIESSISIGRKE